MSSLHPKTTLAVAFLFLLTFFTVSATAFGDEGAATTPPQSTELKSEDQVLDALNNVYGPGFISKDTSTSVAAQPASDPAGDINPPEPAMSWKEYRDGIDALNTRLDKGEITAGQHFEAFTLLYNRYGKSQNSPAELMKREAQQGGRAETREIEVSLGDIPPRTARPTHVG